MTIEQPDLFGLEEPKPVMEPTPPADNADNKIYVPFLPGVKAEDSFQQLNSLAELARQAQKCERCRLRSGCSQVVFGEGNPQSRIVFIGEGPGQDEDIQGRPFVGKAGQLLNKILEAADFSRPEVYICNVVKCRPPGNRLPNPDEVKECSKWLEAQIRILKPQIIVCLGAMASKVVIDPNAQISKIRGNWFNRQGVRIMATFHPAALLRNEAYKRPTWEDFKQIRDLYKKMNAKETDI
ncbi:uracil-DNA glycosylase [Syntrophomonas palmitatica]|uniref:uracil-DNA glycosylase n=1 Tax=Syntrophomonas palmitatica TaxID=402877 RepID=UPI0009F8CC5E|nr:uracil-DNA glycosylase [Syntrophomonas palmitatica]